MNDVEYGMSGTLIVVMLVTAFTGPLEWYWFGIVSIMFLIIVAAVDSISQP